MDGYLPLEHGRGWQVHGGADNVILSRYPLDCRDRELVISYPLPELGRPDFHYGQAMARVDLAEAGPVYSLEFGTMLDWIPGIFAKQSLNMLSHDRGADLE